MAQWEIEMDQLDLFDIFNAREDNFTNMLYFLYKKEPIFRTKFLKLIFGEDFEEGDNKVFFKTRTAYWKYISENIVPDTNTGDELISKGCPKQTGKIVPDIILHNKEYFAIIEVKIFSGEGKQQTERYFEASKNIMENLKIEIDKDKQKYYFLTVNKAEPDCKEFSHISWTQIADCMGPNDCENEMAKLLTGQFEVRIESINYKDVDVDGLWKDQVKSIKWSGAIRFYTALESLFKKIEKENNIQWAGYHWTGYNKSSNSYELSASFYPDDGSWQGKKLEEAMQSKDPNSCYDYHFEFKWNEATNNLTMRLDYHLYPYHSKNDIEKIKDKNLQEFANKCNKIRADNAREYKEKWKEIASEYKDNYNHRITNNLMALVTIELKSDELEDLTVNNVLEKIAPFIEKGTKFMKTTCCKRHTIFHS